MKTKNMLTGLMAIALLALPAVSLANTYQFINTSGDLQSMETNSSSKALATAPQLGIHSGVILVGQGNSNPSTPMNTTGSGNYYQFVDTGDDIQGLWATNSSVALATAFQLGIHSGVILAN